ncbi:MAG: TetR family transcriptional regulator C-terminal domain-containing protein [Roseibium sp.]|uniref:TetR/AcrR family transcriptional regulator n=1 Tax=Roseibium sp. TaxID=1936156 RepID=UPI001B15A343|nr:TetR/AcrR family transcriptional regulator [Roseibium sp.]MBO6507459.1 TetR family transcriptional regulator C-terminal domain-containing protein [Roseibium sp.]MBO6893879.1 TetR family transcriptional regulator C-terminal domain-containing protein [Roseibium sp.]MBO6932384.1 TetR family transcriptional regulator C-terminal domain-containing protein [Roseibium sp.]
MARTRNEAAYETARTRLLDTGLHLIRVNSFASVGINDILRESEVPKGSFYHYFDSKQTFGIAVARHYHDQLVGFARDCFADTSIPALARLKSFFEGACDSMRDREFAQGCLMCNLSTELSDKNPEFQAELDRHWKALVAEVEACLAEMDLSEIGLSHLSPGEAADWLMNSWSGALTRMKVRRDDTPLALFMRTIFKNEGN